MPNQYCVECDKDFKSLTGFNGHNQWKHQMRPGELVSNSATGRTTEVLEKLSDRIEDLQMEVRSLRANNNRSGNGNGNNNGTGNGNGNNRGNNSPSNEPFGIAVPTVEPEPESEPYFCIGCEQPGIKYRQKYCGNCNEQLNWNGIDR